MLAFLCGCLTFEMALLVSSPSFMTLATRFVLMDKLRLLRWLACSAGCSSAPAAAPGNWSRLSESRRREALFARKAGELSTPPLEPFIADARSYRFCVRLIAIVGLLC